MKILNKVSLILILCAAPTLAQELYKEPKVPAELQPFVEKDMKAIALESADLNGDGRPDYILVLDSTKPDSEEEPKGASDRPMLIITRDREGKLTRAARNDDVVYCGDCGGVYGDPFDGVSIQPNGGFTVRNIGGSSDRWLENYEFKYSRPDKTWLFTRSVATYYNVFRPRRMKTKIITAKTVGKVSFSDFRMENLQPKKAK